MFIAHSISSQCALPASDACPDLVLALILVEGDQTSFDSYNNAANDANTSIPTAPAAFLTFLSATCQPSSAQVN